MLPVQRPGQIFLALTTRQITLKCEVHLISAHDQSPHLLLLSNCVFNIYATSPIGRQCILLRSGVARPVLKHCSRQAHAHVRLPHPVLSGVGQRGILCLLPLLVVPLILAGPWISAVFGSKCRRHLDQGDAGDLRQP